jgi:hypothetical protein
MAEMANKAQLVGINAQVKVQRGWKQGREPWRHRSQVDSQSILGCLSAG